MTHKKPNIQPSGGKLWLQKLYPRLLAVVHRGTTALFEMSITAI